MPRGQKCEAAGFVEHELYDFVLERNSARLKVLLVVKTCVKRISVVQKKKARELLFQLSVEGVCSGQRRVCAGQRAAGGNHRIIEVWKDPSG